jgi:hypothetical protein
MLRPRSPSVYRGFHRHGSPSIIAGELLAALARRHSAMNRSISNMLASLLDHLIGPENQGLLDHDLTCHASLPEQLVRASRLGKRKSLRDERLDLLLSKEVEQGHQILSKPCRSQPFEPLDAVGDHPFPAREKPAASNVQPEDRDCTKAMTTTWTT